MTSSSSSYASSTSHDIPTSQVAGAATTDHSQAVVAPLIQFASPYLAVQFTENATLLSQVNRGDELTKEAEILMLRLQDRVAHYILAVDYYGKNSEWSRKNGLSFDDNGTPLQVSDIGADSDDEADANEDATSAKTVTVDGWCRSSLGIAFPPSTIHLVKYAQKEQRKAFDQFILLEETTRAQLTDFTQIGLVFGIEAVERWINDFQNGLKMTGESESSSETSCRVRDNSMEIDAIENGVSSSTSPHSNHYPLLSKISLAAFVEYLTAEILELSCNSARNYRHLDISGFHMWRAVSNDDEFLQMIHLLAIDWHVTDEEIRMANPSTQSQLQSESPAASPTVSLGLSELTALDDGLLGVLESEWKDGLVKVAAESSACWFSQPSEVHSVARRFARGELRDSALSLSLLKSHCRPYRYWGHHQRSIFRDPASSYDPISPGGYEFVSFFLEDGVGQEWHLMIEYEMSQPEPGSRISTSTTTVTGGRFLSLECRWDFGRFTRLSEFISQSKITITQVKSPHFNSNMGVVDSKWDPWPVTLITGKRYVPYMVEEPTMSREARNIQQRIMEEIKRWHWMLLAEGCDHQIMSGGGLQIVEQREEEKEEEKNQQGAAASSVINGTATEASITTPSEPIGYEQHFKSRFMKLLQIVDCAQSDPQLFLANQPQKTRHAFTVALIDESMIASDMTPLPQVLVSLIADYHTFDLPYLDAAQLKEEIKSSSHTQILRQKQQLTQQHASSSSSSVATSTSERPTKRQKLEATSASSA